MLLMWRGLCTSLPEITWAGHLQSGHELKAAVTMVCSPLHENQQGMYNWVTKEFINLSWIYFSGALYTVRTSLKAIITKECVHQVEIISVGVCTIWTRTESHSYQGICSPVEITSAGVRYNWDITESCSSQGICSPVEITSVGMCTTGTTTESCGFFRLVHLWKLLQTPENSSYYGECSPAEILEQGIYVQRVKAVVTKGFIHPFASKWQIGHVVTWI